jgi:1-acyl-sn-glycerol-3-phosphate acyltransferase
MFSPPGYHLVVSSLRVLFWPFTRCRFLGRGNIPADGAAILAPNHVSHFDPPFISAAARRQVDWMAMRELFQMPVVGAVLTRIGTFPVTMGEMDRAAVRTALERLRAGRMLGLFPEGGLRTGPTSVLEGAPLRPGVAALAQMTQAAVVPATIIGTDALYDPRRWRPVRRTRVWVAIGEPLPPPSDAGDKAEARAGFEALLGHRIRDLYERTVREQEIPADCLPQTPQRRKGRDRS